MISVQEADSLIIENLINLGSENVSLEKSFGRVLTESISADRDYPPFDRATMDGIAINFKAWIDGRKTLKIISTISAGQKPREIRRFNECMKIMTGAMIPDSCDTVIPIEEIGLSDDKATIASKSVIKGQFIHKRGIDKKKGEIILNNGERIGLNSVSALASVGAKKIKVSKLPKVAVITTGDEIIRSNKNPKIYQIRSSNDFTINAFLSKFDISASTFHAKDNKEDIKELLIKCFKKYDTIIITGGVSKGEFDYVQKALEELGVEKIFHGISQKPGKPMFFGKYRDKVVVFALPGNPVSVFLCMRRYFIPWLEKSFGIKKEEEYAVLEIGIKENKELTQFLQVHIYSSNSGILYAKPLLHNGSGDFFSLIAANAFIELPMNKKHNKGNVYKIWSF